MTAWQDRAACRGKTALFFLDEHAPPSWAAQAKALCATCPVQPECLQHALDADEQGIWAGTTTRDRMRLRGGSRGGSRVLPRVCRMCLAPFAAAQATPLCETCRADVRRESWRLSKQRARAGGR